MTTGLFHLINPYPIFAAMEKQGKVRVRFAPSPTGGLHLGGVRTVLYNYLFARKHGGTFVLRIEDTDQSRYVEGAEQYIYDCLNWCGLTSDESPLKEGKYGPYRQSERKEIYRDYALQLVKSGHAYYAFDTPEELDTMRDKLKAANSHSLQYDHHSRMNMRNSLSLSEAETIQLLEDGTPYVIRIKIAPGETVAFNDLIRGEISFDTNVVDDKVLLKADGMPTYHLAVVVDDHLMEITHAFRGEEWMPSAPVHILLWQYLFGRENMPEWAHLPLILKPDGNGKLSKRDGDRLGFPVYAMNWADPLTGQITKGFKEQGFLPEAFINLLSVLGWNDGTGKEIFSLDELIDAFSLDRVHISGARFDFEKAKWFNHEWIKKLPSGNYLHTVSKILNDTGIATEDDKLLKVLDLVKDRCSLLTDFVEHAGYFFQRPTVWDEPAVLAKWDMPKAEFFRHLVSAFEAVENWSFSSIEDAFKQVASTHSIKIGELQMIWRVFIVGKKAGPAVFSIAELLGKEETCERTQNAVAHFLKLKND